MDTCFRRNFQDWELGETLSLLETIQRVNPVEGQEDSILWGRDNSKKFTVRSFYEAVVVRRHVEFPWRLIWRSKAPMKVAFFVWAVARDAILTLENLKKRGFSLASRCSMCGVEEETVNHPFLHCSFAREG
uniref:Reverse transcriptase zinc-binding domain-containing protein n=1 Tax=Davidia involucrata TaxID=16924 RepID=A0A5B6YWQ5_DAVIN